MWSPTTGNAWSRAFLERVLPMPSARYVTCAETYLSLWAPLLGTIGAVHRVNALYREHGKNNRYELSARQISAFVEHAHEVLHDYLCAQGVEIDRAKWLNAFRWPDRDQALEELAPFVAAGERFVLVDSGQWGDTFELSDRALRFSPGSSDDTAPVKQVEAWRGAGASCVAVAWPAFEWLRSRAAMPRYLRSQLRTVLTGPRVVLFQLQT